MKGLVATFVTAILGAAGTAGYANTANTGAGDPLLVIGPVESVNSAHSIAVVLDQKVLIGAHDSVTVGNTVAVYGEVLGDGSLNATKVVAEGAYVPGATPVFMMGTVQKVEASIGRAVVSGITVDLTALMSQGSVTPAVGSTVEVSGTQPANNGLLVASGIASSGKALAPDSITGSGKALALDSITGSGKAVMTPNSITGSGKAVMTPNSITGSGKAVVTPNSITGSGKAVMTPNSITGSGKAVMSPNSITGSGKAVMSPNSITGSG